MSDTSNVDLTDPAVRAELGLEERTDGSPPEPAPQSQGALKHIRDALEIQTKAKTEAEHEATQLRRELAIERSALPDFPGKQFFIKNYDGEATPEAIRAAASEAGFVLDGAAPAPSTVPVAELDAHRAVAAVAAGSSTGGDIPLEQALLGAKTPQEVLRIVSQAPPEAGLQVKSNIL